jgi:hypothetical protein
MLHGEVFHILKTKNSDNEVHPHTTRNVKGNKSTGRCHETETQKVDRDN